MTTPTTAAGPTTETGRYFTEHFFDMRPFDILAIEAEARAAALDEARAAVNDCASFANYPETGDLIMRRHALAAIDALQERDGE